MNREQKVEFVTQMHARLEEAAGIFLVDFTGVDAARTTKVRRKLREAGVEMRVVKNRLLKRALGETAFEGLVEHLLVGPNAVLIPADLVAGAKALKELLKEDPELPLKVKGGALPGARLEAEDVERLASLPSREQLVAQFVGLLQAPLRNFAALLQAPLRDLANVLKALEGRKSE